VASAGTSHRDASAADDATSSTQAGWSTEHARRGHDVALENNAQETFHQILDFVHHAVAVQQHADLIL